jgi:hypothetical protein
MIATGTLEENMYERQRESLYMLLCQLRRHIEQCR